MKKKILFVASVATHINTFHLPIIRKLKDEGNTVDAAAFNDKGVGIKEADNYYSIPFERSPFKLNNIKAYKELKRIKKENSYDVVHCHTPVAAMITRLAFKKTKTKVIYTAHGFHFFKGAPKMNWMIFYPIEKMMSKYTDVLITINKEDFELAERKFNARETVYIPGVGIDIDKINKESEIINLRENLKISKSSIILLSVGELNKNKNHKVVIEMIKEHPEMNIVYLIAGEGSLRTEYESYINDNNLENKIFLLGYRNDVYSLMKSSDLFIFPSIREGLPVSIMEAMACGLPIIASEIRGNTDLISTSDGYLLNLCTPEICYEKVQLAISSLDENKISNFNKNAAQQFNQKNILSELKRVYWLED